MTDLEKPSELTLDPANWEEFGKLAHRMVDDMVAEFKRLPDLPAWVEPSVDATREISQEPLPMAGQGDERVYREFLRDVLPSRSGNVGPRFYGWVQGCGIPLAVMADMLASGMNAHLAGYNQSPALVEHKVIDWLRELMGFPEGSSGVLQSGGSMANLIGLAVARNAKAGFDVRQKGLLGGEQRLMVYGSTETHAWAPKAMGLLGLGTDSYRVIPVKPDYTIDIGALQTAIEQDRAKGHHPVAVLATAGTVNTGATDDLAGIADLCAREDLWMHVDGAFGALAVLSPELKQIVKGMERADSLAFDLHKWMYLPFDIACVLVRDSEAHCAAFSQTASYITPAERGPTAGGFPFANRGVELTRSFKALKAWMCLKSYGVEKFGDLILQNVKQARYLGELVKAEPKLELMTEIPLNVVCFRYRHSATDLNTLNQEILLRIQEQGIAMPSSTILNTNFCIRACMVNHRTRNKDLEDLIKAVVQIGDSLPLPIPLPRPSGRRPG